VREPQPISGSVLVDTGPIVAILDETDEHHQTCIEVLQQLKGSLVTCWPVITEVAWLLRAHPRALLVFLSSFGGELFELAHLGETDFAGISVILARYSSLRIQLADASLTHLANRDGIDTIFTLDRRDFGVLRKSTGQKFRLIP
jgi:hypothetical protein